MRRWVRTLLIALTLVAASVAMLTSTHEVYASTTAMQMAAYDDVGNIGMYCLSGTNQNQQPAYQCWDTTGWQTDFYGYWWLKNYNVRVDEYNYSGAYQNTVYIIPVDGSNAFDWWCFYASHSTPNGWTC